MTRIVMPSEQVKSGFDEPQRSYSSDSIGSDLLLVFRVLQQY